MLRRRPNQQYHCRLQEQAFGSLDLESLRFSDGLARHGGSVSQPCPNCGHWSAQAVGPICADIVVKVF
jgi:hypothetical protein